MKPFTKDPEAKPFNMYTRAVPFFWNPKAKPFTPRKKLGNIPPELVDQILNLCSIRTIKVMRLVNRASRTIADRHLFKEVYVAILPKSLNNLLRIARHPTLRLFVKRVFLLNQTLKHDYICFHEWYSGSFARRSWRLNLDLLHAYNKFINASRSARRRGVFPYPFHQTLTEFLINSGHELSRTAQEAYHRQFISLFNDQQHLMQNGAGLGKFCEAMPLLTELRCVEMYEPAVDVRRSLNSVYEKPVPFLTNLQHKTHLIDPFESATMVSRLDGKIKTMLEWLTLTLRHTSTSIRQVSFGSIPQSYWRRGFMDFPGARVNAFGNLRALQLSAELKSSDTVPGSVQGLQVGLRELLRSLSLIEEMDLDFCLVDNMDDWARGQLLGLLDVHAAGVKGWHGKIPQMSGFLRNMKWPKLKTLKFGACGLSETTFCELMLRHKHRLRVFEARSLELEAPENTSWKIILEGLGPQLYLTNVKIGMLQDLETRSRLLADVRVDKKMGNQRSAAYHRAISRYLESYSEAKRYPSWESSE